MGLYAVKINQSTNQFSQIVLFQVIQFSISTQFSSIWLTDRTLSDVTTPGPSGPRSDGNEGMLCISQSSSITRTSPSDCFFFNIQDSHGGVLTLCRDAVCVFYGPSQLGKWTHWSEFKSLTRLFAFYIGKSMNVTLLSSARNKL